MTRNLKLDVMWATEVNEIRKATEHAESVISEVLRLAEEKFQQTTTQPTQNNEPQTPVE